MVILFITANLLVCSYKCMYSFVSMVILKGHVSFETFFLCKLSDQVRHISFIFYSLS